jgi:protein SCO1
VIYFFTLASHRETAIIADKIIIIYQNYKRCNQVIMKLERRVLIYGLVLLLLVLGFVAIWYFTPKALYGEAVTPAGPRPDFTLQSANGPISLSSFRGRFVVLYFGYMSCPDVCPLTLGNLRLALENLGSKASEIQVVFVSVDWKRDTPEKLSNYVHAFRRDFVGVTGTNEQIDAVTRDFGIFYLLNLPDSNGFYTVDHTASIQVLDRQQNLTLIWPHDIQAAQIASDLQVLIQRSSK